MAAQMRTPPIGETGSVVRKSFSKCLQTVPARNDRQPSMSGCVSIARFLVVAVFLVSCSAPGGPGSATRWVDGGREVGVIPATTACTPARGSEDLNPRVDVLGFVGKATSIKLGPQTFKTIDLFRRVDTLCGQCHVTTGNGGRQVNESTFATTFDATWLASIKSEDPAKAMPPERKAYSTRPDGDSVRQLVALLEPWLAQGRPIDMFTLDAASAAANSGMGLNGYAYATMTNLGDCIPSRTQFAQSPSSEMEAKDELFSSASSLPKALSETDLTTFDADILAANGVVAYVPAYPLWSDGSGKLRHIRVPKGTSVTFDKAKQTFTIPPNTRFYKTFFRKVIDAAGHETNRKMETRLIVSRPDAVDVDGTTPVPKALFGTYLWSDDELTATLHEEPYRDGTPFTDKLLEYVTDEITYHDVVQSVGPGSGSSYSYRFQTELAKHPGLVQHYAVPGSIRCVQCHRGSSTNDFVLGFFPLQVAQRPAATGGKYEPVGPDEVNQLQRLIDFGIISGMASAADVVPLENSQLPRRKRTDEELAAQAYMIGNCMHCHNPRGYPSLAKPELGKALNFMPSPGADGGGIFEFSLERMSPIRARGANQDIPIPYITPSLVDYPVADLEGHRMDNGAYLGMEGEGAIQETTWTPKFSYSLESKRVKDVCGTMFADAPAGRAYCGDRRKGSSMVHAPWRSLIYRNVDTPFPYFDDYVPFPHMPMNSAGFDCRASRIMGDWMVSLPAVRKTPDIDEEALRIPAAEGHSANPVDRSPQPYLEVTPGDSRYPGAQVSAGARLEDYHQSVRYKYCEDVLSPDILDPVTIPLLDPDPTKKVGKVYRPDPTRYLAGGIPPSDPNNPEEYVQPAIGVPYHSHWFNYDPTDAPPPWQPRRGKAWQRVLVDEVPDDAIPEGQPELTARNVENLALDNDVDGRKRVTAALNDADLTAALRSYATTPLPFGLWLTKAECQSKLANSKKFGDPSLPRAAWMGQVQASPDSHVYMMSPGAALYRHICFNCHGPKADGKGLQGDALAASSEGDARPANFATGLLGPPENPGGNLLRVFGGPEGDTRTADSLGSRYMAWMALGGTLQRIPKDVIHQVEATRVLGQSRPGTTYLSFAAASTASANMLNLARGLCSVVLPDASLGARFQPSFQRGMVPTAGYPLLKAKDAPFIATNGDWEMWMNLCSRFNRPVVRLYRFYSNSSDVILWSLRYGETYPADASVLDHNSVVQPRMTPDNYYPACLIRPSATDSPEVLAAFARSTNGMPVCPEKFVADASQELWGYEQANGDPERRAEAIDRMREWALRGAINAGMAVFSYLRSPDFNPAHPQPYYNECQLLP